MVIRWVSVFLLFSTPMQNVTMPAAHHDHIQLKQNLNRHKGGHDRLVKSYEKL
jgi:hypothetical protein